MATPGIGVSAFNDLDACFHVLLARGSGNALTSTLTSAVPESVGPLILRALEDAKDWPATARALNAQHRLLLTLVSEGRGAEAADLVEQHIRGLHGTLVNEPTGP